MPPEHAIRKLKERRICQEVNGTPTGILERRTYLDRPLGDRIAQITPTLQMEKAATRSVTVNTRVVCPHNLEAVAATPANA